MLSPIWLFVTPWTVAHQAPLSMGFARQEYWSELAFPSSPMGLSSILPAGGRVWKAVVWSTLKEPIFLESSLKNSREDSWRYVILHFGYKTPNDKFNKWYFLVFNEQDVHLWLSSKSTGGTSLVVQWLRFHAPIAGIWSSIPGRDWTLQIAHAATMTLHATAKTQHSQINK